MHEGARIHRRCERDMEKYGGYQSEVWLSAEFVCRNAACVLDVRRQRFTDGGKTVIDEIKTTSLTPQPDRRIQPDPLGAGRKLRLHLRPAERAFDISPADVRGHGYVCDEEFFRDFTFRAS